MGKIAFIYPGQGAQYIGMGKDFYDYYDSSKKVFALAKEVTGIDFCKLIFEENTDINITRFTQLAVLVTASSMFEALKEEGYHPDVCAGLSLGEYSALGAAEAIEYDALIELVDRRATLMHNCHSCEGGMAAVIGVDADVVKEICEEVSGYVTIANYNCPGQLVISGEKRTIEIASEMLMNAGARNVIALNVSGAFHSEIMRPASDRLKEYIEVANINKAVIPVVTNVNARYTEEPTEIRDSLSKQVCGSVLWQQSIEEMIKNGVSDFVEVGPGKSLTGFMKRIDRSVNAYTVNSVDSIKKIAGLYELKQKLA